MTASDKAKKELDQRKEFKNILCDLANDQNFMRDGGKRSSIYIRLENLYYAPEKEDRFCICSTPQIGSDITIPIFFQPCQIYVTGI